MGARVGVIVAPAVAAEELEVDAENIVSPRGLLTPKFVTTKGMAQITATAIATRGGDNLILGFMTIRLMTRPHHRRCQLIGSRTR